MKLLFKYLAIGAVIGVTLANTATLYLTSKVIDSLINDQALALEIDKQMMERSNNDYAKIWDLHRRVLALENETDHLEAHIKWFVMRRSGTNELRKMEAAMEKAKADAGL